MICGAKAFTRFGGFDAFLCFISLLNTFCGTALCAGQLETSPCVLGNPDGHFHYFQTLIGLKDSLINQNIYIDLQP